MVMLSKEYCRKCESIQQHLNGKCAKCIERKRREQLAVWQAKTTDEKLLDLHKRVLELEKPPLTF